MEWLTVRCVKPCKSRSRYAPQPSLMTVVPGSIQSRIMVTSVSAVLSGTGTRNVLPDSRSTTPNTHCPLAGRPVWYFRRPNLLSSISMVLLCRPTFSEQPSIKTCMVSLQNMPQSVMVLELRRYSCWICEACSRCTMSYEMSKISRKVRLLCWNHEACFMDFDSEHLTPTTFFRHRHLNP